MKKIASVLIIIYIIIAIFVTVCLLSFNRHKVSQFGDKTLVIIDKEEPDLKYKSGDLVIVGHNGYEDAQVGDTIFFYKDDGIKVAEIKQKNDYGEAGIGYKIDGNYQVIDEDIIGTSRDETVIGFVGGVLSALESKWGFLFIIVFPSLLAFLKEIRDLIVELRNK